VIIRVVKVIKNGKIESSLNSCLNRSEFEQKARKISARQISLIRVNKSN
jgi:hypothetical protein